MLAAAVLAAALAVGVALSAHVSARRVSQDEERDQLLSRWAQIAAEDPVSAEVAAGVVVCRDGMCEVLDQVNDLRTTGAAAGAVGDAAALREAALADEECAKAAAELQSELARFLATQRGDCPLRSSLCDALGGFGGATVEDAIATMLALDHALEVAPDGVRDSPVAWPAGHGAARDATAALTVRDIVDAIEAAHA